MANDDFVGMIQGGFGALGQGLGGIAQRQEAEAAKRRPIHPALNKYLNMVFNGEMSGPQAAIAAQLEMQPGSGNEPQSFSPAQPVPGQEGALSPEAMSLASRPPTPMVNPNQTSQPVSLTEMANTPIQFTAQDLKDAESLLPYARHRGGTGGLTFEQMLELENIRFNNRQTLQTTTEEGKTARQGAAAKLSKEQMAARIALAREQMKNARELMLIKLREARTIRSGRGDSNKLSTLVADASRDVASLRAQIKSYEGGMMRDELGPEIEALKKDLDVAEKYLNELRQSVRNAPSTGHSYEETTTSTPNGMIQPSATPTNTQDPRQRAKSAAGIFRPGSY